MWAGIGAYRLSADQIADNVQYVRGSLGVDGVILFSYDSLADAARGPGFFLQVGARLSVLISSQFQ